MTEVAPTLGDRLASTRKAVSDADFSASKELIRAASWAVWGEKVGDLSIFEDNAAVPRLRKDVVLIGANFGLGGDSQELRPFENFHVTGSDTKFRNGVRNTELEGAFLTDLVKDYPTKYADGLAREIAAGTLDTGRYVLRGFRAEQEALGLDFDTLYIPIGAQTRQLWDLLVARGVLAAEQRVFHRVCGGGPLYRGKPVENLRHYSAAVNMREAVEVLLSQPFRA